MRPAPTTSPMKSGHRSKFKVFKVVLASTPLKQLHLKGEVTNLAIRKLPSILVREDSTCSK